MNGNETKASATATMIACRRRIGARRRYSFITPQPLYALGTAAMGELI